MNKKRKWTEWIPRWCLFFYVKENRLSATDGSTSKSRKGNKFNMSDERKEFWNPLTRYILFQGIKNTWKCRNISRPKLTYEFLLRGRSLVVVWLYILVALFCSISFIIDLDKTYIATIKRQLYWMTEASRDKGVALLPST